MYPALGSTAAPGLQQTGRATNRPSERTTTWKVAQWPKSASFWKSTTAHVPPNPASLQGSETDSDPDPPGIRE